jgi:hypothetical protein
MGPIGCPETSVRNYHSTLHNNPEELKSHLHRGGSLNSRKHNFVLCVMRVGLGLSSFRKSKIKSEECFHLSLEQLISFGVGWTHVAQDGSGNSAIECMGFYGESSLKILFCYVSREN